MAKCVSENHYLEEIICKVTSLNWVFKLIKKDYDLKVTGIDFLNLTDIKYELGTMTPAGYFQQVKAYITANTAHAGQIFQYKNNEAQAADETLGPCFQDYILYNTIRDIINQTSETHQTQPNTLQAQNSSRTDSLI